MVFIMVPTCIIFWENPAMQCCTVRYYSQCPLGFTELKEHYHTILQLMPDNYEQSLDKLQDYVSDDNICMILSSSNLTTANKIILDSLIERISCREDILDLCSKLEIIATSHQLRMLVSQIKSGEYQNLK